MALSPTFLVTKTIPLRNLEALTEALNAAYRNSARPRAEINLDAPVVVKLFQTELTDGSFVYDIKIEEAV